jgi:hypothetical protein
MRKRGPFLERLKRYVRDFLIDLLQRGEHLQAWIEMLKKEVDPFTQDNSFGSEKKKRTLYRFFLDGNSNQSIFTKDTALALLVCIVDLEQEDEKRYGEQNFSLLLSRRRKHYKIEGDCPDNELIHLYLGVVLAMLLIEGMQRERERSETLDLYEDRYLNENMLHRTARLFVELVFEEQIHFRNTITYIFDELDEGICAKYKNQVHAIEKSLKMVWYMIRVYLSDQLPNYQIRSLCHVIIRAERSRFDLMKIPEDQRSPLFDRFDRASTDFHFDADNQTEFTIRLIVILLEFLVNSTIGRNGG